MVMLVVLNVSGCGMVGLAVVIVISCGYSSSGCNNSELEVLIVVVVFFMFALILGGQISSVKVIASNI